MLAQDLLFSTVLNSRYTAALGPKAKTQNQEEKFAGIWIFDLGRGKVGLWASGRQQENPRFFQAVDSVDSKKG